MANLYEIYPGGARTGEIVIETDREPNQAGIVWMPADEFDESFSPIGREARGQANYHRGCGIAETGGYVGIYTR